MLSIRNKSIFKSIFFRDTLVSSIFQSGFLVMRICFNCENSGSTDNCKIGKMSGRCAECARKNLVDYNLAFFFPSKWVRIWKKRNKKTQKVKEAFVKFNRLQREIDVLEKEKNLVESEIAYISELEIKKQSAEQAGLKFENFLFDVASENFVFENFDWFVVDFGGIVAKKSGNSQSF